MTIEEAYKIPCPFCGRTDIGIKERILDVYETTSLKQCWAYCRYCEAEGQKVCIEAVDREKGRDVEAAALDAWTIRKALPPVQPVYKRGKFYRKKSMIYCSNCADCFDAIYENNFNYCPNCGVKISVDEPVDE